MIASLIRPRVQTLTRPCSAVIAHGVELEGVPAKGVMAIAVAANDSNKIMHDKDVNKCSSSRKVIAAAAAAAAAAAQQLQLRLLPPLRRRRRQHCSTAAAAATAAAWCSYCCGLVPASYRGGDRINHGKHLPPDQQGCCAHDKHLSSVRRS